MNERFVSINVQFDDPADEFKALRTFALACKDTVCLSQFLSNAMLEWFKNQKVSEDGYDLFRYYDNVVKDLKIAKERLSNLHKDYDLVMAKNVDLRSNLNNLTCEHEELEAKCKNKREDYIDLVNQTATQLNELVNQYSAQLFESEITIHQKTEQVEELQNTVTRQTNEILKLKARFYDLDHPGL